MDHFMEKDLSVVQQYLSGHLDEGARSDFERRLEQDPRLREEIAWLRAMCAAIEDTEDQRLKLLLQTADQKQRRRSGRKKSAIAAGILLISCLLGVFFLYREERAADKALFETAQLDADIVFTDLLRTRSGMTPDTSSRAIRRISTSDARRIDSLYNTGGYQQLLAILDTLPASASILFYQANCLMALGRNAEAIPVLHAVEDYQEEIYANFAQWYLALAYYSTKDNVQAKVYASKAFANEGINDVDRNKARLLLEVLNE